MIVLNWQILTKVEGVEFGRLPDMVELSVLKGKAKVAFAATDNIKKLSAGLETKNKTKEAILVSYSEKDSEGKPVINDKGEYQFPDGDAKDTCIKEITDLEQLDSGIELITISRADLNSMDGLSGNLLLRLGDLITD